MNLSEFTTEAMLESGIIETLDLDQHQFKYIRADKKVRSISSPLIAQYFLVELDENNVRCIESIEGFQRLQKQILMDVFFDMKNDVRWNLYLIFLTDSYKILKDVPMWDVEIDDDYARKYFFSYPEGLKFFQRESFFNANSSSSMLPTTPVEDWYNTLLSIQLTGVLTEKYLKANVINYLDGDSFLSTEKLSFDKASNQQQNQDNKYIIERIEKIKLGSFRKHCFGEEPTLKPGLVNLIHGSNGCGKTSMLEAIEFALTGEIKRLKDFNESFDTQPLVSAELRTQDGEINVSSNRQSSLNKDLDRIWYGTPSGREKSTLNNNFNHFNSFNSETAYKFALEERESKNDYSEMFSRLLYDDETLTMEKLWRKYKDYLDEELDRRLKNFDSKQDQLVKIENDISQIKREKEFVNLNELLEVIKYKNNDNLSLGDSFERCKEVFATLQALKPSITSLEKRWNDNYFVNISEINKVITDTDTELKELNDELAFNLEEKQQFESDKTRYLNQITEHETSRSTNESKLKELMNSQSRWQGYRNILAQRHKVNEFMSLIKKKEALDERSINLKTVMTKYPRVFVFELSDVSTSNKEISQIQNDLDIKRTELSNLEGQIKVTSGSIKEIKQLKIQLNRLALEMLALTDKANKCPLCETLYQDKDSLISRINLNDEDNSSEEQFLADLEKKKCGLAKEITQINQQLEESSKRQINYELLLKTAAELTALNYPIDLSSSTSVLLVGVKNCLSYLKDIESNCNDLVTSIKGLQTEGFSIDTISAAQHFERTDAHYLIYTSGSKQDSFEIYISNERQNVLSVLDGIASKTEAMINNIKALDTKISLPVVSDLQKRIATVKLRLELVNKMHNDYKNLCVYFNLKDNYAMPGWFSDFWETALKIEVLISQLRSINTLSDMQDKAKVLIEELSKLEKQILRGKIALEKLNSLKHLNEYSMVFIKSNIQRIEYFFKALHTPREFISLDANSEGVVAMREKDSMPIRMYQMSTGQRVSLALAIMFSLHIAAPRAPRILLLDEPVANMDDLHLLNLLDILREFALRNVQIVFTTANPDVAGVFRRKFSFFGPEFIHYDLIRRNDDNTEIITVEYTPDSEEFIVLNNVS